MAIPEVYYFKISPTTVQVHCFFRSLGIESFLETSTTVWHKDINGKTNKTEFIHICNSKNGSRSSAINTGILNQNSNTVIYEKYCSYH